MRQPRHKTRLQAINGHCLECGTDSLGYSCEAKQWFAGLALLVVHPTKILFLSRLTRNAPTCHHLRVYRAGVFVCGGTADSRYVGGVDHG
jgi:hypothetical protein